MDVTSGTGPAKRARAKVKVTTTTSKEPAPKPRARRVLTTKAGESGSELEAAPVDMTGMIATAAYFIAAERNFVPGHELDDWLEAERRLLTMMA
jgi:Protein of unknown function (DUF2934)